MTYKIFYCCGDVSESTAYLFINILDVVYALINTLDGFGAEKKTGTGILSIVWLVCAIGSLIVYLAQKEYKTTLHYVYMVLRFFFVVFNLVMVTIGLVLYAMSTNNEHEVHPHGPAQIIVLAIFITILLYDLYLSILLKRIVAH